MRRGPLAPVPGQNCGEGDRGLIPRARVPAQVVRRRHAGDAKRTVQDHEAVHAQAGKQRPGHDVQDVHHPSQPGLFVRGGHGAQVPDLAGAATNRNRALRQLTLLRR